MPVNEKRIRVALRGLERVPGGHDAAVEIQKALSELLPREGAAVALGLGVLEKAPAGARNKGQFYTRTKKVDGKEVVPQTIELVLVGPTSELVIGSVT